MRNRWAICGLLGGALALTQPLRASTDPLDAWSWLNPSPTPFRLNAVARLNDLFIAVGEQGLILTSPDAKHWSARQIPGFARSFFGLACQKDIAVAVGELGTVAVSSDGFNWRFTDTGGTEPLHAVAWSAEHQSFIAAGGAGVILTSVDGKLWTRHPTATAATLRAIVTNGPRLLIVGDSNATVISGDAQMWFTQTAPGLNHSLRGAAWDGRRFVVVGEENFVVVSPNGLDWDLPAATFNLPFPRGLIWTGARFVEIGGSGISSSEDGFVWRRSDIPLSLRGVVWTGREAVAVGISGAILTSGNGLVWTEQSRRTEPYLFHTIVWTGKEFIAVGLSAADSTERGAILASGDGERWESRFDGTAYRPLYGIAARGTEFIAVGAEGTILRSQDGRNWAQQNSGTTAPLLTVSCDERLFVAGGTERDKGLVLTSSDGINWTRHTLDLVTDVRKIIALPERAIFMAIGRAAGASRQSRILTSADGAVWTEVFLGSFLHGITKGPAGMVAVGPDGVILTSIDGLTWNRESSPDFRNLNSVAANGSEYVAVGDSAVLTKSGRGPWVMRARTSTDYALNDIAWSGRQFVAVGQNGATLRSAVLIPGQPWLKRFRKEENRFLIEFTAALPGRRYRLERSEDLRRWTSVVEIAGKADRPAAEFPDTFEPAAPGRFYRVLLLPEQ